MWTTSAPTGCSASSKVDVTALLDLPVWRPVRGEPGAREVVADALEALAERG